MFTAYKGICPTCGHENKPLNSASELIDELCGCGRQGRYTHFDKDGNEVMACNKYKRCLTRDELEQALVLTNKRLVSYVHAVNQIDDYFEYQMESKKDQKNVHHILGNLTDSLST